MAKTTITSLVTLFTIVNQAQALTGHVNWHSGDIQKRHQNLAERYTQQERRDDAKKPGHIIPIKARSWMAKREGEDGAALYTLAGCYASTSSTSGMKVLTNLVPWNQTSIQTCVESCATAASSPYPYAGVLAGKECWCDFSLGEGALQVGQENCNSICAGSDGSAKWCGGETSFQIYYLPGQESTTTTATTSDSNGSTVSEVSTSTGTEVASSTASDPSESDTTSTSSTDTPSSTPSSPTTPTTIVSNLGAVYSYSGCFIDNYDPNSPINSRVLRGPSFTSEEITPALCATFCGGLGYPYMGTEFGQECFCGSIVFPIGIDEGGCSTACSGEPGSTCGANLRMAIYSLPGEAIAQLPSPTPLPTSSSGLWSSTGCFIVDPTTPGLSAIEGWTQKAVDGPLLSVDTCTSACEGDGFTFSAINSETCSCYNSTPSSWLQADAHDCDSLCPVGGGTCGGSWRVDIYAKTA
ncbi:hypothetical protein FRC14_002319 [Serendipita sp. 396]|nr:hypothetical protein FRC14_002319 [Serendipita sp. 396]KAG8775862.1 hypothetical protein FRC15_000270 [Serendipita sp. 397]KAG8792248.1 hypothetical protein FRC16_011477 [Serendipita sp. 398]